MNKKVTKLLSTLIVAIMLVSISVNVFAVDFNTVKNSMESANVNTDKVTNLGGKVMTILQTVGIVLSIVILIVLGIKYMTGSAEEKAEYKKTMVPYLVGAVLIFTASALAGFIVNIANGLAS